MEGSQPQRLDATDLVLVLLAAPTSDPRQRDRIEGITRLEKLLFLLEHEPQYRGFSAELAEPFTFEPYHYGPYSRQVYDAVELLVALKLLRERRVDTSSGVDLNELRDIGPASGQISDDDRYIERQFALTEDGKAVARLLSTRLSPKAKEMLTELKDRFGRMPLRQLLRYVYAHHETYTTKSRIRSQLG